jgi:hypothetical protein
MIKNKLLLIPMLLFGLFFILACGNRKQEWKGTIETREGIINVTNPKEPMHTEPVLELTEDLVI